MSDQNGVIFGIDLGTTYSCIAYVDDYGKAVVIPNFEGDLSTPSVVQFEGSNRVVGQEAKNSSIVNPNDVVEMVKRYMGQADWRFQYDGQEYTPEVISSYILRRLADDAEKQLAIPVQDVVITCPAYFGIAEREATKNAGIIANLNVREIINEPTAAAIMYGMQKKQDQVVLVYDLGGGTFDITVIEVKGGAITVVATGGHHSLGGRDWDKAVTIYLAEQWKNEAGSTEDPFDSAETRQDLWARAEKAKWALTQKNETKVVVTHAGKTVSIPFTREKFNELTANLLEETIMYTRLTMDDAKARGFNHFDQILLVGGSTKMPQVAERLQQEFTIPFRLLEPDQAVAKGAAIYGQKLLIDEKILIAIATDKGTAVEKVDLSNVAPIEVKRAEAKVAGEMGLQLPAVKKFSELSITNVASQSFGIIAIADHGTPRSRSVIANLVLANDPLPVFKTEQFYTLEDNQDTVELKIMETAHHTQRVEPENFDERAEIGNAVLPLQIPLLANSPIEVTFELNHEGRLHVVGHEPSSGSVIEATIETKRGMSAAETQVAKSRSREVMIK